MGVTSNTDGNYSLDDFEEGTMDTYKTAGGSNLGIVGTSTYVKIGRQVFTVKFDILSMDSTMVLDFNYESLPFMLDIICQQLVLVCFKILIRLQAQKLLFRM